MKKYLCLKCGKLHELSDIAWEYIFNGNPFCIDDLGIMPKEVEDLFLKGEIFVKPTRSRIYIFKIYLKIKNILWGCGREFNDTDAYAMDCELKMRQ